MPATLEDEGTREVVLVESAEADQRLIRGEGLMEIHLVQTQAAEGGGDRQQMAQSRGAARVGRVSRITFHIPARKHTFIQINTSQT